jgi:colanic acid/amylovoran biosynthesis glycosyltransferase
MRIAFLLYHWPVVSETFVMNQITGLLDRGHEVDAFAKRPGKEQVLHGDMAKYNLLERTFYYGSGSDRLPRNEFARVAKAIGLIAKHIHKRPLPLFKSLNVIKFGREASSLGLFYKTVPFLGADKYDIVHCHFGPNGNLAVLLREVGAIKGKIVTAFHGEAGYTGPLRYEKGFNPLFERGDLILPMSEKEKRSLIELGCDPKKILVHRMGVDLSKFTFALRQPSDDGRVHLLTVGRLVEKKGIEYAIRAVASVLEEYPHIEYKIAGDGPLRSDLEHLVDALKVGDKVKILGWRPQEEIIELSRGAHVFLAPSVNSQDGDQEGIPVVLMEALAQGLPVLSTYHSGIPELVQDGVSGFLVPERDVNALAAKLEHLVKHPEIWLEMGQAGRSYVETYYDIDKLNDELVQLYQRLLDGEL